MDKLQVAENTPNLAVVVCNTICHTPPNMAKTLTFRPNEKDWKIIDRLTAKLGIKTGQVIRIALRKYAEAENVRAS